MHAIVQVWVVILLDITLLPTTLQRGRSSILLARWQQSGADTTSTSTGNKSKIVSISTDRILTVIHVILALNEQYLSWFLSHQDDSWYIGQDGRGECLDKRHSNGPSGRRRRPEGSYCVVRIRSWQAHHWPVGFCGWWGVGCYWRLMMYELLWKQIYTNGSNRWTNEYCYKFNTLYYCLHTTISHL
jgi:hypothetical protein